jgi:hypothetical protein
LIVFLNDNILPFSKTDFINSQLRFNKKMDPKTSINRRKTPQKDLPRMVEAKKIDDEDEWINPNEKKERKQRRYKLNLKIRELREKEKQEAKFKRAQDRLAAGKGNGDFSESEEEVKEEKEEDETFWKS